MSSAISLCVPYQYKDTVKDAGARWNAKERVWTCTAGLLQRPEVYEKLAPFVPLMYRRHRRPPFVEPMMIPHSSWGKNLRSVLKASDWKRICREVHESAGRACRICGSRGEDWPVEADERWSFDETTGVQALVNIVAVCPACHKVKHWGRTKVTGNEEMALAHMMRINGWTRQEATAAINAAFDEWERRSEIEWRLDYSWAEKRFGVQVPPDADQRAGRANREALEISRRRIEAEQGGEFHDVEHLFTGR